MKNSVRLCGLILLLIIILSGCTFSGIHLFTVQVGGEVKENSILGQPIKDVHIIDQQGKLLGRTNALGIFSVNTSVKHGVVKLTFEHPDFDADSIEFVIDGKSERLIQAPTMFLKPAGEILSGRIYRQVIEPTHLTQKELISPSSLSTETVEAQNVPGEYNLKTTNDQAWLFEVLGDQGQIIYQSQFGFYTIKLNPGVDEKQFVKEFQALEGVEFITPNYIVQTQSIVDEPENELDLWNMQMLDMPAVWEYSTGDGVLVAVLDTLHIVAHPELVPNLKEPICDITGEGENLVLNRHGLHVAGIIGAIRNDAGVVGVAPDVSILPIRVFNYTEKASISDVVAGIYKAIEAGADVMNMSFGLVREYDPDYDFPDLHAAIKDAYDAGIVMVAAAGNYSYEFLLYPAAYPEVIAVGAVNNKVERATYSHTGKGLELMAPGGDLNRPIISTGWDPVTMSYRYAAEIGTSMAAPHVSGVVALLIASGITDPDYIRLILRETAIDLGEKGYDWQYGYGLVDPFAVLYRYGHSYVFFGYVEDGYAQVRSQVIQVEANGSYVLSGVRAGVGRVIGWVDLNNNRVIDGGDYLGQSVEVEVTQEIGLLSDIQVELQRVPGEFSAIEVGEIAWD